MDPSRLHRNFGVYAVCEKEDKLLVITKTLGPYKGKFDFPGGNVEPGETLLDALHRELREEAGARIEIERQIGLSEFIVRFPLIKRGTTHIHHIAAFYGVKFVEGSLQSATDMKDNDSDGARWIATKELTPDNSSPLILEILDWFQDRDKPLPAVVRHI